MAHPNRLQLSARTSYTLVAGCFILAACLALTTTCRSQRLKQVVVYTSVDQIYALQIFEQFTRDTGIQVRPVFDTEAGKTTGLYRRLLAEQLRPRADVFWNGEICRTLQLVDAGLAADLSEQVPNDLPQRWQDPQGRWAAFSLRARVIVFNTKHVKPEDAPKTLHELTLPEWRGKVAIANPLFGTTATHVTALHLVWGDAKAGQWLQALKANDARIVEGNSVVRDVVARGEVLVGLTDTDDVFSGIENGMPIDFVLPDQDGIGTLVIPNSVLIVAGGPNPQPARRFVSYLLQPEVEQLLAEGRARQVPVRAHVPRPSDLARLAEIRAMVADYGAVANNVGKIVRQAEAILR